MLSKIDPSLPIRLDHGVRCHRPPLAPYDLQARTMVAMAIETEAAAAAAAETLKHSGSRKC